MQFCRNAGKKIKHNEKWGCKYLIAEMVNAACIKILKCTGDCVRHARRKEEKYREEMYKMKGELRRNFKLTLKVCNFSGSVTTLRHPIKPPGVSTILYPVFLPFPCFFLIIPFSLLSSISSSPFFYAFRKKDRPKGTENTFKE
jgi:hypothetical protein